MNQVKKILRELIRTQYFAVLNTLGEGLPYSNLVSFAITDDLRLLIFVTDRNTRKFSNIRENSNISLLIDNRTNRPSDISQAIAVTVIGAAHEEEDKKNSLKDIFLARHPRLRQFVDNPNNAMILVAVSEYIIAGFDKTQRLVVS
ncbi:MAG: pyridoxamine 5'-phosphate oxidase family protein [Dehalococcoidales bacterium]|nr:pyridoxamine 5'-phosphate oxidase family protein [Dehalococcoidales bacterium]